MYKKYDNNYLNYFFCLNKSLSQLKVESHHYIVNFNTVYYKYPGRFFYENKYNKYNYNNFNC